MRIVAITLGLLVLAAIGVVAFGWYLLKRVARKSFAAVPERISLIPEPSPDWKNVEEGNRAFEDLTAMRFTSAGTFRIPELNALAAGFVREEDQLVAAVFEQPDAGLWADICIEFEDGGSLTVSNAPHGAELETMPGHRKIFLKTAGIVELVGRIVDERGASRAKAIAPSEFAAVLCEAYARDYDWRKSQGGGTVQETLRIMEQMEEEKSADLPCGQGDCPYAYDKNSDREIEGMPFPEQADDRRACPTYRHICPQFMEELGFTIQDLQIRATIHCGSVAGKLVQQGKLSPDSQECRDLFARLDEVKRTYPMESYPQYYR